jgi:hypothetical protein
LDSEAEEGVVELAGSSATVLQDALAIRREGISVALLNP